MQQEDEGVRLGAAWFQDSDAAQVSPLSFGEAAQKPGEGTQFHQSDGNPRVARPKRFRLPDGLLRQFKTLRVTPLQPQLTSAFRQLEPVRAEDCRRQQHE